MSKHTVTVSPTKLTIQGGPTCPFWGLWFRGCRLPSYIKCDFGPDTTYVPVDCPLHSGPITVSLKCNSLEVEHTP